MKTVVTLPGATNCYIVFGKDSALLIDPGTEPEKIVYGLDGLPVSKIILTHGHADHIYDVPYFKEKYNAVVYLHENDLAYTTDMSFSDPVGFDFPEAPFTPDILLKEGDRIEFEDLVFTVLHTPGHTPGSICLECGGDLFSGDTLFRDGIGRTDFPGSNSKAMINSLTRLSKLDGALRVLPGHGYPTSIDREKNNFRYYI